MLTRDLFAVADLIVLMLSCIVYLRIC